MPMSPSSRRAWIEMPINRLKFFQRIVALLAEGVDRNTVTGYILSVILVALLAEGVDRNSSVDLTLYLWTGSPSSRRAWIEILWLLLGLFVALSPSSRRAWIEISDSWAKTIRGRGRPPRGGRG